MSGWFTHRDGQRISVVPSQDMVARRFAERHAGRLRFCHDTGCWFGWDGAVWRRDRTGTTSNLVREIAEELGQRFDGPLITMGGTRFIGGVDAFARNEPALAATAADWDRDTMRLGTPGGTIDLTTGTLVEADPADGITRATAVAPSAHPDCPMWCAFLIEATRGDHSLVGFLQRFLGYALTGETREHILLFGHGEGGNGKTVLLNTIGGVLGDYAAVASPELLAAGTPMPSGELARLAGARLVTAGESEEGRTWAQARLKLLTGGDPIATRRPGGDLFTVTPRFKLFVVGNRLPVLRSVDAAMRRRLHVVPFEASPAQPDRKLEAKLRQEWPQILRWMIHGCLAWQAGGLLPAQSMHAETAAYLGSQDVLGQFLEEACETGDTAQSETAAALYAAWCAYATAAGEVPGSQKMLAAELARRGMVRDRTESVRLYRGIRLRSEKEKRKKVPA